ncbi:MAG: hypothetical protein AB1Z67_06110 [Candidatus Limnocylindrales bacterium]
MTGMPSEPKAAAVSLVQPGWTIYSKDGVLLGEVVAADQRFIHVRAEKGESNIEIRTDALVEQEEPEMRARVGLTAAELSMDDAQD